MKPISSVLHSRKNRFSSRNEKRSVAALSVTLSATVALVLGVPGVVAAEEAAPEPLVEVGSQVQEIGPGRLDPDLGGFVVTDTDVNELSISRRHLVADTVPRHLVERDDLAVFGVGWQAQFLGGMTAFSMETAPDEVRIIAPNGARHRYLHDGGNTYRAADGSELTTAEDEIVERISANDLTFIWRSVAGRWRITAVGNPETGMDRVAYDSHGRVSRLSLGNRSGAYADINYAKITTAQVASLGSIRGMVDSISYVAHAGATPKTVAAYLYDHAGRLATVVNPAAGLTSSYGYDQRNRLVEVDSLLRGSWALQYEPSGEIIAVETESQLDAANLCTTAKSYMWGESGCWADPVHHYGLRSPKWKTTPTGKSVVGITYDHCTSSPDQPDGFDFRVACDMHDYGYGVIASGYLRYSQKEAVDDLFYTTLTDHTCPAYSGWVRWMCYGDAWVYRQGVRTGDPNNGK